MHTIKQTSAYKTIMNNSSDIVPTVREVMKSWNFDITNRLPLKVDMASLLSSISRRGSILEIENYKNRGPKVINDEDGDVDTTEDSESRRGRILGLVTNNDTFSFSVKLLDESVVDEDNNVGKPRNFSITDFQGKISPNWDSIKFSPSDSEEQWLSVGELLDGRSLNIENFVNPEKWQSFYTDKYVLSKLLISRLAVEIKIIYKQVRKLVSENIKSHGNRINSKTVKKLHREKGKSVRVECHNFMVYVDSPDEFKSLDIDVEQYGFIDLVDRYSLLTRTLANLKFYTRSVELAVVNRGVENIPQWLGSRTWNNYKQKGKRTVWKKLSNLPVKFLYRNSTKTKVVSPTTCVV